MKEIDRNLTWLIKDRQAKIGGFELGIFLNSVKEKVLGLEVPVHDSKRVTSLDNLNNGLDELGGLTLTVVALLNDPVEELAALAELHDEVDGGGVLVGAVDPDDVGVFGEVVHYLNLPPNVIVVLLAEKLPLGD